MVMSTKIHVKEEEERSDNSQLEHIRECTSYSLLGHGELLINKNVLSHNKSVKGSYISYVPTQIYYSSLILL